MNALKEKENTNYTDIRKIEKEIEYELKKHLSNINGQQLMLPENQ